MTRLPTSRLGALLLTAAGWIGAGCGGGIPEDLVVVRELAAALPEAEVLREVGEIDLGTPEARAHLGAGWSADETGRADGTTFVWSRGDASHLTLFVAEPRELRLEARCMPLEVPDTSPQTVLPVVNGHKLPALTLSAGMASYSLVLPEGSLQAGLNHLELRYGWSAVPRDLGLSGDGRRLAVAWDRLRLHPAPGAPLVQPRVTSSGRLFVPFGSEVAYYLRVEGPSALTVDHLSVQGADGRLEVVVREDGGPERSLAVWEARRRRQAVRLPGEGGRVLRLALRAVPAGGVPEGGGLVLAEPAIRSRRQPPAAGAHEADGASPRPPILVYLVDTLRADRLGVYGGRRSLSSHLDTFAADALMFERAIAQAPWTRPAVASLLTGLDPLAHGVRTLDDRLPEELETLPERLRQAGYRTAAFSTNWHVREATGLAQGFDDFLFFPEDPRSDAVTRRVLDWLDTHRGPEPFFLYIHALDPHAPYEPPEEYRRRFASGVDRPGAGSLEDLKRIYAAKGRAREELLAAIPPLYDGEVAFNDASFGELLEGLRQRGLYDPALILFLSDHGEELGERGSVGHGQHLYREVLEIPWVLKLPRRQKVGRVPHLAQQIDLLPTLLAYLGLETGRGLAGTDLLGLAELPAAVAERPAFSHLSYAGREGMSVVLGPWKYIEPWTRALAPGPTLYHTGRDPLERLDLSAEHPVWAGYLATLIRRGLSHPQPAGSRPVERDEAARRGLEALGYL